MMEHCSKGSLLEVLTQDSFELVWAFRLTFAMDACRGLAYLHSKKIFHGRLSSTNCVIDNQWTLKLTGVMIDTWCLSLWCVCLAQVCVVQHQRGKILLVMVQMLLLLSTRFCSQQYP